MAGKRRTPPTKPLKRNEFLTIEQCLDRCHLSRTGLLRAIGNEQVKAHKTGGRFTVCSTSLVSYLMNEQSNGGASSVRNGEASQGKPAKDGMG